MIKYRDLSKSDSYTGIQRTSMNFIMLNADIAVFIIKIFNKPIGYKGFLWIKPIVLILLNIEMFLLISLIHMSMVFSVKIFIVSFICTIILTLFGYKWFPYWEGTKSPQ